MKSFYKLMIICISSVMLFLGCGPESRDTKEENDSDILNGNDVVMPDQDQCPVYGVPSVQYIISGKITDVDGNPIEGISIKTEYGFEVGVSSEKGEFNETIHKDEREGLLTVIIVEDVDGVKNGGLFEKQSIKLSPEMIIEAGRCGDGAVYQQTGIKINMELDESSDIDSEIPDTYDCPEYGTRPCRFSLSGFVKNSADQPVEGIKVVVPPLEEFSSSEEISTLTDSDGKYEFTQQNYESWEGQKPYKVEFEDIDGEANGGDFQPKEVPLQMGMTQDVDECGFGAEYEQSEVNVNLKKK